MTNSLKTNVPDRVHSSGRYGGFGFTFKRINVILGANGCGKSSFLNELRGHSHILTDGGRAIYIEGGRTIKIKDILQVDHTNYNQFDRYDLALNTYENKRNQSLADRVFDALLVLDKRDAYIRSQHSDAVVKWMSDGAKGICPVRRQPPLERLFELFNEIFPQIKLKYNADTRQLFAVKNNIQYGPSSLSDGEKQVFSILADLIELEDVHKLIIADEPELNLHPELAERVWTLIENEFPDKRFIYATHSISFALRENVETVYVLSHESKNITVFNGWESLKREDVTAFLGALPGVLSANRVLVTEGHEKSFDSIFYRWLLDDEKLEIFPGGGCTDVIAIAQKKGLWDKISSRISLIGIIDADFRSEKYLNSLASSSVYALPLHEAESYLCMPEIICRVAERIGSQEEPLTEEHVSSLILKQLENNILSIAARRVFSQTKLSLAVSIEKKLLASATDYQEMLDRIKQAAQCEIEKTNSIGPSNIEALFNEEVSIIKSVIASKDVLKALQLLPGKEILSQLAPKAGCKNAADLMRSLRRNFKPSDFLATQLIATKLTPPVPI